jgi:hypothetical protein
MFITAQNIERYTFTSVDKYVVYDEKGGIHVGQTIRNYLDSHFMKYGSVADAIGITRGGLTRIFDQASINTVRLRQISDALNHDFFQYLLSPTTKEEIMKLKEPEAEYQRRPKPKKKKSTIKVVLEFDEDTDPDSPLIERLSKMIEEAQKAKDSEE